MPRSMKDLDRQISRRIALGRRGVLAGGAAALTQIASPTGAARAASVVPDGKVVLAWHTNIAARWLDPQQHDGTASPDNFLMALHDGLIKNFRDVRYDHPALAERFEFAEDAKSATFLLRAGTRFHDGAPVTPADVKWSYEHYRGAWGEVLRERSQGVELVDDRTVRFHFKEPFLDFPILLGTSNVCGAGWVVPAKYYEQVGQAGFLQKPIGAGPYKLVSQQQGVKLEFEAFAELLSPGPHQTVDDGQRAGGRDARRDAGARRGGHRVFHPRRIDRPGEEQSEAAAGAGGIGQLVAGVPRLPKPRQPVP